MVARRPLAFKCYVRRRDAGRAGPLLGRAELRRMAARSLPPGEDSAPLPRAGAAPHRAPARVRGRPPAQAGDPGRVRPRLRPPEGRRARAGGPPRVRDHPRRRRAPRGGQAGRAPGPPDRPLLREHLHLRRPAPLPRAQGGPRPPPRPRDLGPARLRLRPGVDEEAEARLRGRRRLEDLPRHRLRVAGGRGVHGGRAPRHHPRLDGPGPDARVDRRARPAVGDRLRGARAPHGRRRRARLAPRVPAADRPAAPESARTSTTPGSRSSATRSTAPTRGSSIGSRSTR